MALKHVGASCLAAAALLTFDGAIATASAQETSPPARESGGAVPGEAEAEEAQGPLVLSGGAALVSDYRFRGVSLNDEEVALQPELTLTHESGFYVGFWGSNIQESEGGADIEIDLLAGYSTEFENGVGFDIGLTYYLYPGDNDINYFEPYASLSFSAGPVTPTIGVAYAPDQDNLDDDNFYVFGSLEGELPGTPVTLTASLGYETGSLDFKEGGGKLDWSVGANYSIGAFTVGLSYVDTDIAAIGGESGTRNLSDATVVASLTFEF